jgi:erythromycin 12 hydroxylase
MMSQAPTATVAGGPPSVQDGGAALRPWMARMRADRPVWPDRYGVHQVFRYADVQRVLADHADFSSDRSRLMPGSAQLGRGNLTMMDPPEHRQLRRLVSQAFTAKVVAALEPRVRQVAGELLDTVDGEFDVVGALAHPLPVIVIAELLGVPIADRDRFRAWSLGFGRGDPAALREMDDYFVDQARQRRRRPGADLISRLTEADVDGERLDDGEIASMAGLLLLAGHITTTVLIGNAVLCLDEMPEGWATAAANPGMLPGVIEETLRYRPPFTQMSRIATRDVEVAGVPIPAGSLVNAWLLSANHDERIFAEPERFDPYRSPNRQAAFGYGIHFCLGAPLARLEGRIALELLMLRFPRLHRVPGTVLTFHEHPTCALKRLPVAVD